MAIFEARLNINGEIYILNNHIGKFDRAAKEVGDNASPLEFLAAYDRLAGQIRNEAGENIENGIFNAKYQKWKHEQPAYIKTLEERERNLNEGERQPIELNIKNIDHKRAFLGTLMTISAALIAGLFLFMSGKQNEGYYEVLAMLSGVGLAVFVGSSAYYLRLLLSQESEEGDDRLEFVRKSKEDFIEKVGIVITDLDSYEKYRQDKYEEEKKLKRKIRGSDEKYFKLITGLFILSAVPLTIMFIIAGFCGRC